MRQYTKNDNEYNLYSLYERLIKKAVVLHKGEVEQTKALGISKRTLCRYKTILSLRAPYKPRIKTKPNNKYGIEIPQN